MGIRWSQRKAAEYIKRTGQTAPQSFHNAPVDPQRALSDHNHGEVSFMHFWRVFASSIPFPFQRRVNFKPNRNFHLDFYDSDTKLGVEISGGVHIATMSRLEDDFEKINAAMEEGIVVLHYSVRQVVDTPDRVIKQVLELLMKRREENQIKCQKEYRLRRVYRIRPF